MGDREIPASLPLAARLARVRAATERLCRPLAVEDYVVQSMPDASPSKWHLAHTSWFFETFVLGPYRPGYQPWCAAWAPLFNSYYVGAGPRYTRSERGLLTRPTVVEVFAYRHFVSEQVRAFLDAGAAGRAEVAALVELGLQHEQQHQELLLTDLLHAFSRNPLRPAYAAAPPPPRPPRRSPGSGTPAASAGSATPAPTSPSTTRGLPTASTSSRSSSPRAR